MGTGALIHGLLNGPDFGTAQTDPNANPYLAGGGLLGPTPWWMTAGPAASQPPAPPKIAETMNNPLGRPDVPAVSPFDVPGFNPTPGNPIPPGAAFRAYPGVQQQMPQIDDQWMQRLMSQQMGRLMPPTSTPVPYTSGAPIYRPA